MNSNIILIGAGGHAKVILQILNNLKYQIIGFVDEKIHHFFNIPKLDETALFEKNQKAVLSFGATTVEGLKRRTEVFKSYNKSLDLPAIIDVTSIISTDVSFGRGVTVGQGAIINSNAILGEAVIVNSGSIVEHDVTIHEGSHIAPGSIILGGAVIGKCCMIGAGAVILPNTNVPDGTLVPALTRYSGK